MRQIFPAGHPEAVRQKRRAIVRRIILLTVALAIVPFIVLAWPTLVRNIRQNLAMEAARSECLRDHQPTARVMYDDDSSRIPRLLQTSSAYHYGTFVLSRSGRGNATYLIDSWQRLLRFADPTYPRPVCVFLNGRASGASAERLVAVNLVNRRTTATDGFAIDICLAIVRPIYAMYRPDLITQNYSLEFYRDPSKPVRFFSGQPSTSDPSRFTLPFEVGDETCELEGFLNDDDTAKLEIVRAPAKLTRPPDN